MDKITSSYKKFLYGQLRNPEEARAYLEAALEDSDNNVLMLAVEDVAKANRQNRWKSGSVADFLQLSEDKSAKIEKQLNASKKGHVFLFCDNDFSETAYLITPNDNGYNIQHQYNCSCCDQFHITGKAEPINKELAEILDRMLGCQPASKKEIKKKTGLKVERVFGEGLLLRKDGRYIATDNCD